MAKNKTIYDLELHEQLTIHETELTMTIVMKVHGGWIYKQFDPNLDDESYWILNQQIFVPYPDEDMKQMLHS